MRVLLRASRSGSHSGETRSGDAHTCRTLGVLGLVALAIAAGPATSSGGSAAAPIKVKVTMTDYAFALSKRTVRKGAVVFQVVNKGEVVHDFKIAGRKTPIYETDEAGTLRVVFRKVGRYPYICTILGHAAFGMKGVLRVVP